MGMQNVVECVKERERKMKQVWWSVKMRELGYPLVTGRPWAAPWFAGGADVTLLGSTCAHIYSKMGGPSYPSFLSPENALPLSDRPNFLWGPAASASFLLNAI